MVVGRDEVAEVARWAEGIERVRECIVGRFGRPEPRRRALDYLRGLLSPVERKNGWQLAEQRFGSAQEATPLPTVCSVCCKTTGGTRNLVRDDLRDYVVEHLADAGGVLVVDETGFLKKGDKSVGVQRQYSGTAGRIENSQVGVFLTYAGAKGRTLLDRELYLPQVWAQDRERRLEAGVPEDVAFRTKPQLAQLMLEQAADSGVPFSWFTGDEVYGSGRKLWLWLEREGIPHVMAIKSNEKLWAWTDKGPLQVRADRLVSGVEESAWARCSAGNGAKGPGSMIGPPWKYGPCGSRARATGCWRGAALPNPGSWPTTCASAQRTPALAELVRVAGTRWATLECFEEAKGEVGLDQYEVRKWDGWYRHITLAMLAQAYLAVIRHQAMEQGEKGATTALTRT